MERPVQNNLKMDPAQINIQSFVNSWDQKCNRVQQSVACAYNVLFDPVL